jgi:anti-anti-sigma factor
MNVLGSSFFTVADRPTLAQGRTAAGPIVVWLKGEHDLSTEEALCRALARAIALDSAGLVLDLSQVTFIAVSTLRVVVRAQQLLRHQSRSLTVRAPSACARRAIGACGVGHLLGPDPEEPGTGFLVDKERKSFSSWVAVPAARRAVEGKQTTKSPEGGGRLARSGR